MSTVADSNSAPPAERPVPPSGMSYQQFLEWAHEDTHAEWVKGKVVFMSPVSLEHVLVKKFVMKLVDHFVEARNLGEVLDEPFQMKTGPDLPGRSPDVIFVTKDHHGRLKDNYLDGPADLVIEVISPDSRGRDHGEKFYEYEEGGVKEYWLIDPPRQKAEFYQLGPDGFYRPMTVNPDGRFESGVLAGFWLNVQWLWQRPMPTLARVLEAWSVQ